MASMPVHSINKWKGEHGDRERERNQNVTSKTLSMNKELVVRVCMETDDLSRCIRLRRFESNERMQLPSLALAGRKLSTQVPANASISFLSACSRRSYPNEKKKVSALGKLLQCMRGI